MSEQISTDKLSLQNYFEHAGLTRDMTFVEAAGHLSKQEDG